jgi:hypothetical protein
MGYEIYMDKIILRHEKGVLRAENLSDDEMKKLYPIARKRDYDRMKKFIEKRKVQK